MGADSSKASSGNETPYGSAGSHGKHGSVKRKSTGGLDQHQWQQNEELARRNSGERWWRVSNSSVADERLHNGLNELQLLDSHLDIVRLLLKIDHFRLASASDDCTIILWNYVLGQKLCRLEGHTHGVTALLMVSETMLASGSSDKTIRLWNIDTMEHATTLDSHRASVTCLAMLRPGVFCSGGNDQQLRIWTSSGQVVSQIERQEEENLNCLLYVGNDHLVTGSNSSLILVYNTTDCVFLKLLASTFHRESVRCLVIVTDDLFASSSLDGTIVLWHRDSLTPARRLHFPTVYVDDMKMFVCSVADLLPLDSGKFLAAAIGNGFRVFDTLSGDCVLACPNAHDAAITRLVSMYGDARLLTCSQDSTVKMWAPPIASSHSSSRFRAAFSSSPSKTTANKTPAPRLVEPVVFAHTSSVSSVVPLGETALATCGADGCVIIWRDGERESQLRAHRATLQLAGAQCEQFGLDGLPLRQDLVTKIVDKLSTLAETSDRDSDDESEPVVDAAASASPLSSRGILPYSLPTSGKGLGSRSYQSGVEVDDDVLFPRRLRTNSQTSTGSNGASKTPRSERSYTTSAVMTMQAVNAVTNQPASPTLSPMSSSASLPRSPRTTLSSSSLVTSTNDLTSSSGITLNASNNQILAARSLVPDYLLSFAQTLYREKDLDIDEVAEQLATQGHSEAIVEAVLTCLDSRQTQNDNNDR